MVEEVRGMYYLFKSHLFLFLLWSMCSLFLWWVYASLAVLWYELQVLEGNGIFQEEENISSQASSVELLVGLMGEQGGLGG